MRIACAELTSIDGKFVSCPAVATRVPNRPFTAPIHPCSATLRLPWRRWARPGGTKGWSRTSQRFDVGQLSFAARQGREYSGTEEAWSTCLLGWRGCPTNTVAETMSSFLVPTSDCYCSKYPPQTLYSDQSLTTTGIFYLENCSRNAEIQTMSDSTWVNTTLTLSGCEIPVQNGYLPINDLRFYAENPRIYSLIQKPDIEPSQEEIFNRLKRLDHVKQLIQSIRANGGLTDPMFVRDRDFVVLEGNSRLAAYRELARNDAIKWGKAKVRLLPSNISEKLVFALLGEYHIIGRKDWAPFEQAGYLYRRHTMHKISAQSMASEMGLPVRRVNHLISTYDFMVKHDETSVTRWSYYDEYLKANAVKKTRLANPKLDDIVVSKIKCGEIPAAVDVRDKLVKLLDVAKVGPEPTKILVSGNQTFDRAFESAQARGIDNMWLRRFKRFRTELQVQAFMDDLEQMSPEQQKKCIFEIGKIQRSIERIIRQRG